MARAAKYFSRYAPPILWALIIFLLSSLPSLGMPRKLWVEVFAYIAHFTEYAVLALLVYNAFSGRSFPKASFTLEDGSIVAAWVVSALYAVSDEIHQAFVPGRQSSVLDFIVDVLGIAFGVIALPLLLKW